MTLEFAVIDHDGDMVDSVDPYRHHVLAEVRNGVDVYYVEQEYSENIYKVQVLQGQTYEVRGRD